MILSRASNRQSPDTGQSLETDSPFRPTVLRVDRPLLVVNLVGIAVILVGLWLLMGSDAAFSLGAVLDAILSQLATTLPAAVSILLATAMNVAAGAAFVRFARWRPFETLSELVLAGLVGAVLLDMLLLLALAPFGFFRGLPLALVNIGLIAAGFFVRPWLIGGQRVLPRYGVAGWLLIALVWSAPLLLQLASPVVPFLDVLPNHVAPVEHLRTYGSWETLAVSPSPIYGPSRLFLGFVALLGTLSTLTGQPAPLAVAAFALPLTILLGMGSAYLATTLATAGDLSRERGEEVISTAGYFALLTVPLTFVFLRLPDARASVLVFPIVAFTLATLVLGRGSTRSQAAMMAAGLAAGILVHPLGGLFAIATVGIIALLTPGRFRVIGAGIVGGAIGALPQAAVMLGLVVPAWVALPLIPVGLGVAGWLAGPSPPAGSGATRSPARELGWRALILAVLGMVVVGGVAYAAARTQPHIVAVIEDAARSAIVDYGVLLLGGAVAVIFVRALDAWRVIGAAIGIGAVALVLSEAWPGSSQLAQAIRFEVPKTVGYWLPWFVAIGAGLGLGVVWERRAWPALLRTGIVLAFVVLAAVDFRPTELETVGIEQHRYADVLAISLHEAESGYWVGYPDSRTIVDEPRSELVAAVVAEQRAGRLGGDVKVLHIAPSFQQWDATPLGVFTGVMETDATTDPEDSIHTAGGRLKDIADMNALMKDGGFGYVVVEGDERRQQALSAAAANGFHAIWQNDRAVLLAR